MKLFAECTLLDLRPRTKPKFRITQLFLLSAFLQANIPGTVTFFVSRYAVMNKLFPSLYQLFRFLNILRTSFFSIFFRFPNSVVFGLFNCSIWVSFSNCEFNAEKFFAGEYSQRSLIHILSKTFKYSSCSSFTLEQIFLHLVYLIHYKFEDAPSKSTRWQTLCTTCTIFLITPAESYQTRVWRKGTTMHL